MSLSRRSLPTSMVASRCSGRRTPSNKRCRRTKSSDHASCIRKSSASLTLPRSLVVRRLLRSTYVIALFPCWAVAQQFALQCPVEATTGLIEDPASWADQCFAAANGRLPAPAQGETAMAMRDINLDGSPEHLEVRGTGQAAKQIYVFSPTEDGYEYLGRLDAHPSFTVQLDADGVPTIEYQHRFGADDVQLKRIQYVRFRFVEVDG